MVNKKLLIKSWNYKVKEKRRNGKIRFYYNLINRKKKLRVYWSNLGSLVMRKMPVI